MKQEYQNNAIVKSLLNAGFSEDYIEKSIASGDIKIEKSKSEEEMDRSHRREKDNAANDEKHIKDLEKDKEEDEKDEKDLDRDRKTKEKRMEKSEDKEDKDKVEKGFTPELMKSFGDSIGASMVEAMAPIFRGLNARLDAQDEMMKSMSKQAPEFKSAGITHSAIIEKSFPSGDDGKRELSVTSNRAVVKSVIEKALDSDPSFGAYAEDVKGFLMYPEATTIGEGAARYMYEKMNIKLAR